MDRRIIALQKAAKKKAREAYERVEKTLTLMLKENKKINFQTVAHLANVSTAYLYKNNEIKTRIQTLRNQQKKQSKIKNYPQASDNSKAVIISKLREEIKRVRNENFELRRANEVLAGKLYQLQNNSNLLERFKVENNSLKQQIKELIEQLETYNLQITKKVIPISKAKVPQVSDYIKNELERAGIKLNSTLTKVIKLTSEETVLNAIKAYKEALLTDNIKKPGAWLKKAIEEKWQPNK